MLPANFFGQHSRPPNSCLPRFRMTNEASPTVIRLSWRKKVVFALIVTTAFFLIVETALALFGVAKSTDKSDPYVGFSSQIPLFEKSVAPDGEAEWITAENKLVWFNSQRFPAVKPAGTRRVFCLGGSTTFGRPYSDSTSFCGWLREFLPIVDSSTKWEVINAGGVSYASYRVAAVMEELAAYEPDLFIVYTGQNEFLERRTYANMFAEPSWKLKISSALSYTRTWSLLQRVVKPKVGDAKNGESQDDGQRSIELLPGEVNEMLNHTVGPADYHRDDTWRSGVLQHYRVNLQRMTEIAKDSQAKILFVVPASNERHCSPFKAETNYDWDQETGWRFENLLATAKQQLAADNAAQAVTALQAAKELDPLHAKVNYDLGTALFAVGDYEAARVAFQAAIDNDVCPLRAPSDFIAAMKEVADRNDVPLVDFPKRLREVSGQHKSQAILGDDYFLDHVHPTIEAHKQLSLWIVQRLQKSGLIAGTAPSDAEIAGVEDDVLFRIDRIQQAIAMRNLAKVLHWAGKFEEAIPRALDALATFKDDSESLLILADSQRQTERIEASVVSYERLLETSPMYLRAYAPYGELLFDLGKYEQACDTLSMAMLTLPVGSASQARAQFYLSISFIGLQDYDAAIPLLEEILSQYPEDIESMCYLAQCRAGKGENQAAIELCEQVLQINPSYEMALEQLDALREYKP